MSPSTTARPATTVTVVVPSYNQGQFLRQTLDSLLDQNYPALEILVMDGGSTDDSVEILKSYGDRIQWVSEKDGGQSAAIQKGFARANGEWITWLNSDDFQTNGALHRLAECVAENHEIEVAIGQAHYVAEDGTHMGPYPTIPIAGPGIDVGRELFEKGYVAQPSIFYRKSAYEQVGGLDSSLNFVMDYDLWAKFAVGGCKFGEIKADISANRWHDSAKTASQIFDLYAELMATQRKHFGVVSPYLVQAVSDKLYNIIHRNFNPGRAERRWRMLYFKAMWVCLNGQRPWHCIKGLLFTHMCATHAVAGDRITNRQLIREYSEKIATRLGGWMPRITRRSASTN